jgi:nitrile hydratase subunit beta
MHQKHAATGIHDMGGVPGWGSASRPDPAEPVFKEPWEGRAFALALLSMRLSGTNLDAFRHAMNRHGRDKYIDDGYYGRWLHAAETLLLDSEVLAPGSVDARLARLRGEDVPEPPAPEPVKPDYAPTGPGSIRTIDAPARFAVGQSVRARTMEPPGHTRLCRYAMGHVGTVEIIQPAQVLPDSHAHFEAENAQHVYTVRFSSTELFGADAEDFDLFLDLYEDYLEAA